MCCSEKLAMLLIRAWWVYMWNKVSQKESIASCIIPGVHVIKYYPWMEMLYTVSF